MLPSSTESLAAFDRVLYDACALLRPPEKLNVAEWADKYAYLSSEGSAKPGKFYTSTAEYQREPMEMLTPGSGFETVVLMWSSQVGKTQIGLWFSAYHIEHDPAPILFVEPDETLAATISKDRIDPMIRDTPRLKPLFKDAKTRGSGNDKLRKQFPGGQLTFAWASSPTQMASRPIRILITDESGAYANAQNKEGNPVTLARARMATFKGNRKHLNVSSPRLRRTCEITAAFDKSDQRYYFVPCPQCGHMQRLVWENLHWPPGKPEACYYVCEANGCEILETDKYAMIRQGEWRATNPGGGDGRTAGYQLSALYSTIGYTWRELIDEFIACESLPDRLQAFTNTKLGLPWDEEAEGADLCAIQRRAEKYPCQAPDGTVLFTIGADVQKNRIEGTRWGWGLNEQSWVVEHRVFHGDPLKPDVWEAFTAWRRQEVAHASGLFLPTACTFIDSGDGNRTEAVYAYARKYRREHVYPCKGSSQPGAPLTNRGSKVGRFNTLVVSVGTSTAKDIIYGRLNIEDAEKPGYIHTPSNPEAGCDTDFYKQLTAEKLVTKHTPGGDRAVWENQPGHRNEALDCAVYALAARWFIPFRIEALARALEARAAKLPPEQRPGGSEWKLARVAQVVQSALSSASSPASPSPAHKKPFFAHKNARKRIFRPGSAWIQQ
jgi:phage terminase large subunit GpA-like protein